MKKMTLCIAVLAVALVATAAAQNTGQVAKGEGFGLHNAAFDGAGNRIEYPGSRYGASIWNNYAWSGWFCFYKTQYVNIDWGILSDHGNGMPDEIVDGFKFNYCTDYADPAGLDWNVFFYDSCTGWADYSMVQEAGFIFTGLPNSYNLPPNVYWSWNVWFNLSGYGSEFLLGSEIGIGQECVTPMPGNEQCGATLTLPPLKGGNDDTGTEDAWDLWQPNGNFFGTYWFGGYPANPYASYMFNLYGPGDPAVNTSYKGIGMQGNEASLYVFGSWTANNVVTFLLRRNGLTEAGGLIASTGFYWPVNYMPGLDVTLVPTMPFLATVSMAPDWVGDFDRLELPVGSYLSTMTLYIQGGITDYFVGGSVAPIDLSEVVVTN